MENPGIRRRVDRARADFRDLRVLAEQRLEGVESELWAWIRKLQAEATKAQRQALRARDSTDHYRVLGLAPGATLDEVKAAWRQKMRETHPDRFAADPDAEARAHHEALAVNLAYQELTALLTGRESRRAD